MEPLPAPARLPPGPPRPPAPPTTDEYPRAPEGEPQRERFDLRRVIREALHELRKVAWPSRPEVARNATVVVAVLLLVAMLLALADVGLTTVLDGLFDR
ncbi:MAG: preprotein translocase subunit SecE [Acidimicrobiales bacterium]